MNRLFSALLALTVAGTALPATAQEIPAQSITVSGQGEVHVTPDRALLHFTLQDENRELAAAKDANNRAVAKILQTVKPFSLPDQHIRTSALQVYPRYDYNDNKSIFRGYQVSRSISLTIDNLSTVEKLVDALVKGGVERVDNLTFTVKDSSAAEREALAKATAAAKAKAQVLAGSLGGKLGPVDAIVESGVSMPSPQPPMFKAMRAEMAMADGGAPAPMVGEQTVSAAVTVRFDLLP